MDNEKAHSARQAVKLQLGEYRAIKREAAQIEEQLQMLTGAPSGTQLDGMPRGSGVGDPVGRIVAQRGALTERYEAKLAELLAAQRHVEELIETLEPTERTLLRHRYIEGMTWEGVCVAVGYSWRQTHNIHARALDKLTDIAQKGPINACD